MKLAKKIFLILILILLLPSCLDKTFSTRKAINIDTPIDIVTNNTLENSNNGLSNTNYIVQKSGILLGISRVSDSTILNSSDKYRTLWIYQTPDGIKVVLVNDEIIVPHGDDFYSITKQESKYLKLHDWVKTEGDFITYLDYEYYFKFNKVVSNKLEEEPEKKLFQEELKEKAEDEDWPINLLNEEIMYIGNEYICVKGDNYITGGGTYKNQDYYINLYNLNNIDENNKVDINKIIDEIPEEEIEKLKNENSKILIREKMDNDQLLYLEKRVLDDRYVAINRENGKLKAQIPLITESEHYGNGSNYRILDSFISLDVDLHDNIKNHDILAPSWGKIKSYFPNAKDAVSSPLDNMLVVLTDKKLLVFEGPDYHFQKADFEITIDSKEKIIMNQWATGDYVEEWTNIIKKYIDK